MKKKLLALVAAARHKWVQRTDGKWVRTHGDWAKANGDVAGTP